MSKLLAALFLLALTATAAPAPVTGRAERALGPDLAYVRLRALPDDLPTSAAATGALVLDLRYLRGESEGAAALGAWLKLHASRQTPVYVLVNPATSPAVLDLLENQPTPAGLLSLGAPSSRFVPDVTLNIAPVAERAAYEALDQGTPIEALLADNPDKPRHDEAAIAKEHATAPAAEDEPDVELTDDAPAPAAAVATPPPLIDRTLQRAVQLHRALVALRRISPPEQAPAVKAVAAKKH